MFVDAAGPRSLDSLILQSLSWAPSALRRRGANVAVFVALLATGIALPVARASTLHGIRPRAISLANPTVFTDDPLVAGVTPIKAEHVTQLRAAVNFYRAAAGHLPVSFSNDPPAGIRASDILDLRNALDPARAALNLAPLSYTALVNDGTTPVLAAYIQELREAARVIVIVCGITVTNPSVSIATEGVPFSEQFTQNGAIGAATFTIDSGSLPDGLGLASNGLLSGTPTATGSFPITIHVADVNGCAATSSTYNLQIVHAPSIGSFVAASQVITSGASTNLTASFSGGTAIITNNVDASTIMPASGVPAGVSPATSTTYRLTVTNAIGDSVTALASVSVVAAPSISGFSASQSTITIGTSSQLTGTFSGGTGVISNNLNVSLINAASGTPVSVSPLSNTTFTLTVTNAAGTAVTSTATVTVIPPPSITSFAATPPLITAGTSSLLSAVFSGGAAVITNNRNATTISPASGGSDAVSPTADTTYTLTVANVAGTTVTATAAVDVVAPPVCGPLTVSTSRASGSLILMTFGDVETVTPIFADGIAAVDLTIDGGATHHNVPIGGSGRAVDGGFLDCPTSCFAGYLLTVTNAAGATCIAISEIDVFSVPEITGFSASASSVAAGGTVTLTATFPPPNTGAISTFGSISSGVATPAITIPSSRTFTLTVTNPAGATVSRTLTVNVTGVLTSAATLPTARFGATATRLPNGKVLIAGGSTTSGAAGVTSATIYDPLSNTYAATANLNVARANHTATLLPNGKVLIAGGRDATNLPSAALEIFDMLGNGGVGTFTATAAVLSAPRSGHTATVLPNGNVLLAGGALLSTNADVFATKTSTITTFSGIDGLVSPRTGHTATLLPNGKVLLAGGGVATTELFDWTRATTPTQAGPSLAFVPTGATATLMANGIVLVAGGTASAGDVQTFDYAAGSLSANGFGGGMAVARRNAAATLLPDGRVLIEGGEQPAAPPSASLFDPFAGNFSATPAPAQTHVTGFATLLGNGKVFVGGGTASVAPGSVQLFDPGVSTPREWSETGSMVLERNVPAIALLPDGKVLVDGGTDFFSSIASFEVFTNTNDAPGNFGAGRFAFGGSSLPRSEHTLTLMPNGKVLVAGDFIQVELFDNGAMTQPSGVLSNRRSHTATMLRNGKVLLAGGLNLSGGAIKTVDLYDVMTGTITAGPPMATARAGHIAALLPNGKVLVVGGLTTGGGVTGTTELYDPDANTWSPVLGTPLGMQRANATATLLPNGKVLMVGGRNSAGNAAAGAFLFDWTNNTYTTAASPAFARTQSSATLLPDGNVLLSGGAEGSNGRSSHAELYDPATDTWSPTNHLDFAVNGHATVLLGNGKVLLVGGSTDNGINLASLLFQ